MKQKATRSNLTNRSFQVLGALLTLITIPPLLKSTSLRAEMQSCVSVDCEGDSRGGKICEQWSHDCGAPVCKVRTVCGRFLCDGSSDKDCNRCEEGACYAFRCVSTTDSCSDGSMSVQEISIEY